MTLTWTINRFYDVKKFLTKVIVNIIVNSIYCFRILLFFFHLRSCNICHFHNVCISSSFVIELFWFFSRKLIFFYQTSMLHYCSKIFVFNFFENFANFVIINFLTFVAFFFDRFSLVIIVSVKVSKTLKFLTKCWWITKNLTSTFISIWKWTKLTSLSTFKSWLVARFLFKSIARFLFKLIARSFFKSIVRFFFKLYSKILKKLKITKPYNEIKNQK